VPGTSAGEPPPTAAAEALGPHWPLHQRQQQTQMQTLMRVRHPHSTAQQQQQQQQVCSGRRKAAAAMV
jgi:hypothetical protein